MEFIQKYWDQIFGILLSITGVVWIVKRNIPVGIEGREPMFHLKGKISVLIGVIIMIIGIMFIANLINIEWYNWH